MKVCFSDQAWEDYSHWHKSDKVQLKRIHLLIAEIRRRPFEGIGKPEPLKHALSGWWSRRIDEQHRLVYRVQEDELWIAQCRYHYG